MSSSRAGTIVCDVGGLAAPDASTVDGLARLQLLALRAGHRMRLRNASTELRQLLAFMGLDEVLPVEPRGETEEREDPVGVEEERELDDPAF